MTHVHLDTAFLVHALTRRGPEWQRLLDAAAAPGAIALSAVAWYEFCRGPRTPTQLARASVFLGDDGVKPLSRELAALAGDVFRALGSPRRRANDIAIGVTAAAYGAVLLTRNAHDFESVPGLRIEQVS